MITSDSICLRCATLCESNANRVNSYVIHVLRMRTTKARRTRRIYRRDAEFAEIVECSFGVLGASRGKFAFNRSIGLAHRTIC